MSTTTLKVTGMRCAGCVSAVEKQLASVPGVRKATVNLAIHQATVEHDAQQAPATALVEAVQKAGFEAEVLDDDEEPHIGHAHGQADDAVVGLGQWVRWSIYATLALAVMVLSMGWHHPPTWNIWLQLLLTTPIQFGMGAIFYRGAWNRLRHFGADMDTLVSLGSSVAYFYSLAQVLRGEQPVYFETAAVILVLIGLGKMLEARARHSAAAAIRALAALQPDEATVIRNGREVVVPVAAIVPGDLVLVRPGQRVPVDGIVTEGFSVIDQSMVTGESMPVEVSPGDTVIGGTVNQSGAFRFTARRTGRETLLSQIIELVKRAQGSKASVQRLADKVAGIFVPAVLVIAVLTFIGWGVATGDWSHGMFPMIAVLIVACPCALGLAVPVAILVGTGLGARHGILIKEAAALERAGQLTHIILDKTGTLTVGKPGVSEVVAWPSRDASIPMHENSRVLQLAASVEAMSEHPLGRAIAEHAKAAGVELLPVTTFESMTAAGVTGKVDGHEVIVVKPQTLVDRGYVDAKELNTVLEHLDAEAKTVVAVAVDGKPAGLITLSDQIRPEAKAVVDRLHELDLRIILMTGDREATARAVAAELGIDEVIAEVLPQDKHAKIEQLQRDGKVVAMAGDGINDAPALAAADLGIAMGTGTDIAMESGDIVLVGSDLWGLVRAVTLSRATMTRIRMGLFWAFIYNLVLIPVAAVGYLHPMLAAGAMSLSSVSVIANALWLRKSWKGR